MRVMASARAVLPGFLLAAALLSSACATPIGVVRASTQETHLALTASVLSTGTPSSWSVQALHRDGLAERFEDDPEATLEALRKPLAREVSLDRLFALAELSFAHAQTTGKREHYLAAAVYAYAFLLREEGDERSPLDPRLRLAADLYNRGLTQGLSSPDGEEVILEPRTLALPFGELALTVDTAALEWGGYRLSRFVAVGEYAVRGLRNRYRQPGIGAPLAAHVAPLAGGAEGAIARQRIPPRMTVPVTALVRIEGPREGVVAGRLRGRIEVYAADLTSTVTIAEREVPLELEPTAALAYLLEGAPAWDFEIAGFRVADTPVFGDGLILMHPYRPGRIPVVLVHGTASSPARWAEMINELSHDPVVQRRYQFWLFTYNTGQPVLYSAMLMRRALAAAVADFNPEGRDPALRRMVVIGHSQGGLLTKLMAMDSGSRFWDAAFRVPFDQIDIPDDTRRLLKEAMFFEPVPSVERVVFIATPHRGSYRATGYVLGLIRRLVRLPGTLVSQLTAAIRAAAEASPAMSMSRLPTSVDNMSPGHPFIRTLAASPIDPRVTAHSIIPVRFEGPLTGQTDGIVAYESAHIEGVASEQIVRSGHSTQAHPETIEEVRRILREHLGAR